jgi:hypothetical protein
MSSSINNYVAAEANVNMIILKSTMCSKEQTASMGDRMLKKYLYRVSNLVSQYSMDSETSKIAQHGATPTIG